MPKISVITTVYDAKAYLPLTIKSILAQTHRDLELILVDDGSPNGCGAICDEWAAKDSRIKVIHKPNGGPATASNAGLDAATGDYIGFVDSADRAGSLRKAAGRNAAKRLQAGRMPCRRHR